MKQTQQETPFTPRQRLSEMPGFVRWSRPGEPMLPEEVAWWGERAPVVATVLVEVGRVTLAQQQSEESA